MKDRIPGGITVLRVAIEDVTDREFCEQRVTNGLWGTPLYFADALERWPARAVAGVRAVAQAAPGGVVISCGRGCDRTGFLALLLLHLVGVVAQDIGADYALSIEQMRARDPEYGDELMGALRRHGTSVQQAIMGFVSDRSSKPSDVAAWPTLTWKPSEPASWNRKRVFDRADEIHPPPGPGGSSSPILVPHARVRACMRRNTRPVGQH